MSELITFNEREVNAKGLNKAALPDENKIKSYFFSDHYENLSLLNKINLSKHNLPKHNLTKHNLPKLNLTSQTEKPTLFYPGCGADILFPLIYVEKLFPNFKEINFLFNDIDNNLGVIKTILDDVGISFAEDENQIGNQIKFYWKDILINLKFFTENIFNTELPNFDIYFERSFNIMKSYHKDYEENVFNKLNSNGVLISDSGFQNFNLKKVDVSKRLSSYREMIVGVKERTY